MSPFTKQFAAIRLSDVAEVGGKNASLGEMFNSLSAKGIIVPDGFATTAFCFWTFLDYNNLWEPLRDLLSKLDKEKFSNLREVGKQARALLIKARMPDVISSDIIQSYHVLCDDGNFPVAVRSSATAEDLPQASFAGQHESYLNIRTESEMILAVQKCFASLYTDRAIKYREDNGFAHERVA